MLNKANENLSNCRKFLAYVFDDFSIDYDRQHAVYPTYVATVKRQKLSNYFFYLCHNLRFMVSSENTKSSTVHIMTMLCKISIERVLKAIDLKACGSDNRLQL